MLVKKTIATLARGNFRTSLFVVVPDDEVALYEPVLRTAPIHCILLHTERGLTRQRKFFRDRMLPGTEIVFIDDDVEAVKIKTPTGLQHCWNLDALAGFVFQAMTYHSDDCLLAGVYPVANRDWMAPTVSTKNAYIVGAMYFLRNDERVVEPEEQELEDYARQLAEQAAGRPTLRFNWIGIQTQYFKNPGGLQDTRTGALRSRVVNAMVAQYPSIVKRRLRNPGAIPDLKFLERAVFWDDAPIPSVSAAPSPSTDPATASAAPVAPSEPDAPSGLTPE